MCCVEPQFGILSMFTVNGVSDNYHYLFESFLSFYTDDGNCVITEWFVSLHLKSG